MPNVNTHGATHLVWVFRSDACSNDVSLWFWLVLGTEKIINVMFLYVQAFKRGYSIFLVLIFKRRSRGFLLRLFCAREHCLSGMPLQIKLSFRPDQTLARLTFQRNILQHCWAQHVAYVWSPCCDMLRAFGQSIQHMSQHHATMLQHVALKCCERLARPLRHKQR